MDPKRIDVLAVNPCDTSSVRVLTGLTGPSFLALVGELERRIGTESTGRPWSLALADRVLLVACYYRSDVTVRQLAAAFGVTHSAVGRVLGHLGPHLALRPVAHRRMRTGEYLVAGGGGSASRRADDQVRSVRLVVQVGTRLVLAAEQRTHPSETQYSHIRDKN
ncbi:transposase family protein [Actinomadura rubteroloni]|uniref:transposase family protein n=1 Tax=Actinomadura rubteroloni TaxID=1926885 RepID=UPI00143CF6C7